MKKRIAELEKKNLKHRLGVLTLSEFGFEIHVTVDFMVSMVGLSMEKVLHAAEILPGTGTVEVADRSLAEPVFAAVGV